MSFTSTLSRKEAVAVLLYLPVHMLLLPRLLVTYATYKDISEPLLNFIQYAIGSIYMLVVLRGFLRKEFDVLCDKPLKIAIQIAGAYMASLFFTAVAGVILQQIMPGTNQNNDAVMELATESQGITAATAIFLAPLTEEPVFRAGIFGVLRRRNKVLAYIVGALAFSLYHVIGYISVDPWYILYALQYIPASIMLMLCYERSDTLWTPIFLHMLINAVSMSVLGGL